MIVGKVPSFWNGPFSGAMYGYVSFWERNCCWSVQPGCLGSLFQHPPGGWFRFKGDGVLLFFGEYFGGLVRFGYSTNPNEHQCTNIRGKYTTFAYSMFFYTSSIHIGLNMMVHGRFGNAKLLWDHDCSQTIACVHENLLASLVADPKNDEIRTQFCFVYKYGVVRVFLAICMHVDTYTCNYTYMLHLQIV